MSATPASAPAPARTRYDAPALIEFAQSLLARAGMPGDRARDRVELKGSILPALAPWAEKFRVALPAAS